MSRSRSARQYDGWNNPNTTENLSAKEKERQATARLFDEKFGWRTSTFPGTPTAIKIQIHYLCANFDPTTHVLTSNYYPALSWEDDRFTWDPKEYEGINEVRVPHYYLWTPDITVYNRVEVAPEDDENAIIYHDGTVLFVPQRTMKTYCKPTSKNEVDCHVRIGSWTYDAEMQPLLGFADSVDTVADGPVPHSLLDLSSYVDACPYKVTDWRATITNHKYDCCEELYPALDINFTIKIND